ncbi:MAG: hypothetical protein GXO83_11200 [Chlorobi bacterium]|nr:hypothetical protein [Chlorobiota bacterium]
MKTFGKSFFILMAIFLITVPLSAQTQDNNDIMKCLRNYSLYREYYKQKNYNEALPFWRLVYVGNCAGLMKKEPRYAKIPRIVCQNGVTIYKHLIVDALKSQDTKTAYAYIDTLMAIYDTRIKVYPEDEGKVRGFKGIDLFKFKRNDPEALKQAYTCLTKAVDIDKERAQTATLAAFMDITISLFKDNIITSEEVVDNYARTMEIINKKLDEKPDNKQVQDLKDVIANNFANSGAATCESLIALFTPQFDESKGNPEELKKYIFWLKETGCVDADLYLNSLIALQKIEAKSSAAFTISQLYKKRGQYEQSIKYLKDAVQLEKDNKAKSRYYTEIGDITFRIFKDLPTAKSYAEKAIAADPSSGLPHILLGNIYGNAKDFGDDELAHQAVFWAAVDQYKIARKKDPSLADIADERIATYSKHFPSNETVFFYGFKVGDSYELGGWINEKTTVRIR